MVIHLLSHYPCLATFAFKYGAISNPVTLMGLSFPNRVGLAAGLDKDARCIEALGRLGFGFIEVGTVTPRPQSGNPRPRMFRLAQHGALINRMGFNSAGVDALVHRVRAAQHRCIVGVNIGKNADTPLACALDDYVTGLNAVYPVADYVAVNISSPNTRGLRDLESLDRFSALIGPLCQRRDALSQQLGYRRPILVKISPDMDVINLELLAQRAQVLGVDGLIATNTTLGRCGLEESPLTRQVGGLSGKPLRTLAEGSIQRLRRTLGPEFPLIGVGGIDSAEAACARMAAGADLIQIYTGLIYRGPSLVAECARAIAERVANFTDGSVGATGSARTDSTSR